MKVLSYGNRSLAAGAAALCTLLVGTPDAGAQRSVARWSLAQDLQIGAEEPLTAVADVAVGSDGSMYLLQPGEHLVRVFTAEGRLARTLGRRGRGPGEFLSLWGANWRGDTLIVADPVAGRVIGFLPEGRPVVTISGLPEGVRPRGAFTGNGVLGQREIADNERVPGREAYDMFYTVSGDGKAGDALVRLPILTQAEVQTKGPAGPMWSYFRQPFGTHGLWDLDPQGRSFISLIRPEPQGRRGNFVVTRRAPDGRILWSRRFSYRPQPLPEQIVRDTLQAYTEKMASAPWSRQTPRGQIRDAVHDAIRVPGYTPPVTELIAGRDGTTWLRRGYGATVNWLVLNEHGRMLATLNAPAGLAVYAADRENVWGVIKDADDVPYLVRYRVQAAKR